MTQRRTLLLWVIACLAVVRSSAAQCQYEVTVLKGPPCAAAEDGFARLYPLDISDSGFISGRVSCDTVWRPGVWSTRTGVLQLPVPDTTDSSIAHAVGENGVAVGYVSAAGFSPEIMPGLWTANHVLEVPELPRSTFTAYFEGICDDGTAAGYWLPTPRSPVYPFLMHPDGALEDLAAAFGGAGFTSAQPRSMSRRGDIAGEASIPGATGSLSIRGFLMSSGVVHRIDPPPNGLYCQVFDVGDRGVVVGRARFPYAPLPVISLWRPMRWVDGVSTELPFPAVDYVAGAARGANAAGLVVGDIAKKSSSGYFFNAGEQATVWFDDVPHRLVDSAIAPGPGFSLRSATAINNKGQIAVDGYLGGENDAMLLTPLTMSAGDLNTDCRVDGRDLAILLGFWGAADPHANGLGDVDGDGDVGPGDLMHVLNEWTG